MRKVFHYLLFIIVLILNQLFLYILISGDVKDDNKIILNLFLSYLFVLICVSTICSVIWSIQGRWIVVVLLFLWLFMQGILLALGLPGKSSIFGIAVFIPIGLSVIILLVVMMRRVGW
ncbi:MAG: hypothetical protein SNJ72_01395 [Fimbriimonadales bacterium]